MNPLECINLIVDQYNGVAKFDHSYSLQGVDFGIQYRPDCNVVSFEGSHDIPDWLSNFEAYMRQTSLGGVEAGFDDGMDLVIQTAIPLLPMDKQIYITGHSRGAGHTHIFTRRLIDKGYSVSMLNRVVFGSPKPCDPVYALALRPSPCVSFCNYRDMLNHDLVCSVPVIGHFVQPGAVSDILEEPPLIDPWGPLRWHHSSLYQIAMQKLFKS